MPKAASASVWVPDRQGIIWIDCNPQAGQEMRDIHPFLVLSPSYDYFWCMSGEESGVTCW